MWVHVDSKAVGLMQMFACMFCAFLQVEIGDVIVAVGQQDTRGLSLADAIGTFFCAHFGSGAGLDTGGHGCASIHTCL